MKIAIYVILLAIFLVWVLSAGLIGRDTRPFLPPMASICVGIALGLIMVATSWEDVRSLYQRWLGTGHFAETPDTLKQETPPTPWLVEQNNGWGYLVSPDRPSNFQIRLGCQPNMSPPHLYFDVFLSEADRDNTALMQRLLTESRTHSVVPMKVQLGQAFRFTIDMQPSEYDASGLPVRWSAPVDLSQNPFTIQPALQNFVAAALTNDLPIQIWLGRAGDALDADATSSGLGIAETQSRLLAPCLE